MITKLFVRIWIIILIMINLTMATGYCSEGLSEAVKNDDLVKVQNLLEDGANVNQRDESGKTPLMIATEHGDTLLIQQLIAWGADANIPDAWDNSPLLIATRNADVTIMRILLNGIANPNLANKNNITPLIVSAQKDNVEAVNLLLDNGANINAQDSLGRTALIWAAIRKNGAIVELLLKKGADVNIIDRNNMTALAIIEKDNSDSELATKLRESTQNTATEFGKQNQKIMKVYADKRKIFYPSIVSGRLLIGNPRAPITIVEYMDFQCPYCAEGARLIKEVFASYGPQVRVIIKNNPLASHRQAVLAALYFEAINKQDPRKALTFFELAFQRQDDLKRGESFLKEISQVVGADPSVLRQDVLSANIRAIVADDLSEAGKFHFDGVPVFLVNGIPLYGVPSRDTLFRLIDNCLLTRKELSNHSDQNNS